MRTLIITADDLGLSPGYDDGILEAATAGAVDSVSVMATRLVGAPGGLADLDVALGLHLDGTDRELDAAAVHRQLDRFEELIGRPPDYLDGHRHCHAGEGIAAEVAEIAAERDLAVRSIDAPHRALLRSRGVRTPDLLIGRYEESEPVVPAELASLPDGTTEWMVHPGRADPSSGSSYDAGREEDLGALLALRLPDGVTRTDHRRLGR